MKVKILKVGNQPYYGDYGLYNPNPELFDLPEPIFYGEGMSISDVVALRHMRIFRLHGHDYAFESFALSTDIARNAEKSLMITIRILGLVNRAEG